MKLVINGIPNPGLAVILPAIFKNVSIAAKEAITSVLNEYYCCYIILFILYYIILYYIILYYIILYYIILYYIILYYIILYYIILYYIILYCFMRLVL